MIKGDSNSERERDKQKRFKWKNKEEELLLEDLLKLGNYMFLRVKEKKERLNLRQ